MRNSVRATSPLQQRGDVVVQSGSWLKASLVQRMVQVLVKGKVSRLECSPFEGAGLRGAQSLAAMTVN
jgi:hypothetical protein